MAERDQGSHCLECGINVSVDEDGCCTTCGRDALWFEGGDCRCADFDDGPCPQCLHDRERLRLLAFQASLMLNRLCGAYAPDEHGASAGRGDKPGCLCRWCQARRLADALAEAT